MKLTRQTALLFAVALCVISCNNDSSSKTTKDGDAKKDTTVIPVINLPKKNGANPYATVDVSPMDMSYYPVEYPKLKMAKPDIAPPVVRVIYSRPHLEGRHLFDNVLKYGEAWRLGANEATEIQFYQDVTIQDKKVKAGRYIIYCIPEPEQWNIVLNSHVDSWGLKQERAKDIHRFAVPARHDHGGQNIEYFTIVFEKTEKGADMIMAWGDMLARLPISF